METGLVNISAMLVPKSAEADAVRSQQWQAPVVKRDFECTVSRFSSSHAKILINPLQGSRAMVTTMERGVAHGDYAEIARRPLEAEQCALVVIDIQQKLLPPIFEKERLVRNAQLLIRAAGVLKIPALISTQYAQGLGATVPEIAELLEGAEAIDKTLFSCFGSDAFCTLLKRLPGQRNTLLLCGMESHICVAQTALAALREGYLVHVASDAVSSRTKWNWKIGLQRMDAAGAVISSTEMIIYELMRASSSVAFKELLPHLKG
jgi:nicotinamidase-related amidase